jgi:hypothetical protein
MVTYIRDPVVDMGMRSLSGGVVNHVRTQVTGCHLCTLFGKESGMNTGSTGQIKDLLTRAVFQYAEQKGCFPF